MRLPPSLLAIRLTGGYIYDHDVCRAAIARAKLVPMSGLSRRMVALR